MRISTLCGVLSTALLVAALSAATPAVAATPAPSVATAVPVYPSDISTDNYSAGWSSVDALGSSTFAAARRTATGGQKWVLDIENKAANPIEMTPEGLLLHADGAAGLSPSSTPPTGKARVLYYLGSGGYPSMDAAAHTLADLQSTLRWTVALPDLLTAVGGGGPSIEFTAQKEVASGVWHVVSGFVNCGTSGYTEVLAAYDLSSCGEWGVNSRVDLNGSPSLVAGQLQYYNSGRTTADFLAAFGDYDVVAFGPNVGRFQGPQGSTLVSSLSAFGGTYSFVEELVPQTVAGAPAADETGLQQVVAAQSLGVVTIPEELPPTGDLTSVHSWSWDDHDGWVDVYGYSSATFLGSFRVSNGAVDLSGLSIAGLGSGVHHLVLVGQSSGGMAVYQITIAGLAATGDESAVFVIAAGGLIGLGALLLVLGRRRRQGAHTR